MEVDCPGSENSENLQFGLTLPEIIDWIKADTDLWIVQGSHQIADP